MTLNCYKQVIVISSIDIARVIYSKNRNLEKIIYKNI